MAQFARPSTDTVRESWEEDDGTVVDIFDQIDEVTFDDADFIRSALVPTNDAYVTKLTPVTDPVVHTGHTVRFRYGKDAAAGAQINLTIELRQNYVSEVSQGTLIATIASLTNIAGGWTAGNSTITEGEAGNITDYTNLFLRFVANQV